MKDKKIYNVLVIITMILLVFIMSTTCFANSENKNLITKDFELNTYSSNNNEIQYGIYIEKEGNNSLLLIKVADYNLPSNLYDYKEDIRLRITYSKDDYKVYDCKVINNKTGEVIEDLSEKI